MARRDRRRLRRLGVVLCLAARPVCAQTDLPVDPTSVPAPGASTAKSLASSTRFSTDLIESAGIRFPADFVSLTPNMTLIDTQSVTNTLITIRGIGQARRTDSPVAVFVDGARLAHPAEINQSLFDVSTIEVVRGPMGAVYGGDALGGVVNIETAALGDPSTRLRMSSVHSGGYQVDILNGGAFGDEDVFTYRAAVSHIETNGLIDNAFSGGKADPYRDTSARFRFRWAPTERFRTDTTVQASSVATRADYFNIAANANDASVPVMVNNTGQNDRDLARVSFRVEYQMPLGTLTATSSADRLEEVATGDGFDYLPREDSFFFKITRVLDLAQSQYLDVHTVSQEVRFTADTKQSLKWNLGTFFLRTDQFSSSGDLGDLGMGVFPVYRVPSTDPRSPQLSFIGDTQHNDSLSIHGGVSLAVSNGLDTSISVAYTKDDREQITETPQLFLDRMWRGGPRRQTGETRSEAFEGVQPRAELAYRLSEHFGLFGAYGRSFRSGGFNQTGATFIATQFGVTGVNDVFDAEEIGTLEFGVRTHHREGRLSTDMTIFQTTGKNTQYFYFLSANATQNVGNLPRVEYRGFEAQTNMRIADAVDLFVGYGYTDSEITESQNADFVGKQAPLVSRSTANVGVEHRRALPGPSPFGGASLDLVLRADYRRVGKTYWEPTNTSVRNPVNLLDCRVGIEAPTWSMVLWSRNISDIRYNAEFSQGGIAFKAKPKEWGLELTKSFH
jgi:iron complex outermembrane receptor protein